MSVTSELAEAERRLARMINHRADSEAAEARADKAERIRRDDLRCRDLAAEFQSDFAAFGVEPPMPRADEWSNEYQKRLLRGLQRRLSPDSDLADSSLLDVPPAALTNFAQMIRSEAAKEAYRPSPANLPESVDDPRARVERTDSNTGARKIEYQARRSFIADLSQTPMRVLRFVGKGGEILLGPPMDKVRR
jgi:hypothetical protein